SCGWIDLLGHSRSDPGPTAHYRAARRTRRNGSPLLSDRGRCGAGAHTPAGVAAVSGLAISGIGGRAARSVGTCGGALGPDVRGTAGSRSDLKRGGIFGDNPLDMTGYDDYGNPSLRSSRLSGEGWFAVLTQVWRRAYKRGPSEAGECWSWGFVD